MKRLAFFFFTISAVAVAWSGGVSGATSPPPDNRPCASPPESAIHFDDGDRLGFSGPTRVRPTGRWIRVKVTLTEPDKSATTLDVATSNDGSGDPDFKSDQRPATVHRKGSDVSSLEATFEVLAETGRVKSRTYTISATGTFDGGLKSCTERFKILVRN